MNLWISAFWRKKSFNVRDMFARYFSLPANQNILHPIFAWKSHHFTCLPILEGDILRITNYDYDIFFSIAAWGKSGGSCDTKEK